MADFDALLYLLTCFVLWSKTIGITSVVTQLLQCSRASCRLIHYNRNTKRSEVLMNGFVFANGIGISPDDEYLVVADTFKYRLYRYWLKGPNSAWSRALYHSCNRPTVALMCVQRELMRYSLITLVPILIMSTTHRISAGMLCNYCL